MVLHASAGCTLQLLACRRTVCSRKFCSPALAPIGPVNEYMQKCGATERRQRMYTRSGSAFELRRCASMHAALSAFPERKVLRTCTRGLRKVTEGQHSSALALRGRCLSSPTTVAVLDQHSPSSVLQLSALQQHTFPSMVKCAFHSVPSIAQFGCGVT